MYVLKRLPEDFVVEEIANPKLAEKGRHVLVRATKRNRNTEEVAQLLAERLRVPRNRVGYAGTKDRNAITTQYFSIEGVTLEQARGASIPNVAIEVVGCANQPLALGLLDGNRFTVVARNLEGDEDLAQLACVPNYFDDQRFSTHNAQIGEAIVRKEFAKAVELIKSSGAPEFRFLAQFLEEQPSQPSVAMQQMPKSLLKMYLHAYQSLLWNRVLGRYIALKAGRTRQLAYSQGDLLFPARDLVVEQIAIPIPGFDMECDDKGIEAILEEVLAAERLTPRDFVIRQLPNLSLAGGSRDALMQVSEYSCSAFEDDECHPGKKKAVIKFSLGKGSYATMLLRAILA